MTKSPKAELCAQVALVGNLRITSSAKMCSPMVAYLVPYTQNCLHGNNKKLDSHLSCKKSNFNIFRRKYQRMSLSDGLFKKYKQH